MKKDKNQIQEEALLAILPHNRCGVGISMGVGKTLIGLQHMNKNYTDYCEFLVVAPKKSIEQSWLDDAVKFNLSHLIPHIKFSTYLSLDKQDSNYDVVYLDECHSLLYSHREWLNNYYGKIIGLTGTPPKFKSSEKGRMVDEFCPIIYTYKTDAAIEDDILNEYEIIVHNLSLNSNKNIKVEKKDKTWYTSEQNMYDYWTGRIAASRTAKDTQITRIMRMKAMMEFPSKEVLAKQLMLNINDKCIIFANTMEQADRLCKHSYHSNNPLSEDCLEAFKTGKIEQLSCVLQLSEGINIPELKESIILHAYGNERKTAQRIGRCLRLNPNDKAVIHILCYKNTVDEDWVLSSLSSFDQSKIKYI